LSTTSNSAQETINQRLKILIKSLGLSVRAFSNTLDVPESSTRNYLDKGTKLNSEYLEKIAHHFKSANLNWLITGEGEPVINAGQMAEPAAPYTKNNSGNVAGTNRGTMTQSISHGSGRSSIEPWSAETKEKFAALQRENELLKSQLEDKERTIQILLKQNS
jgi:hypothetical protein